MRSLSTIFVVDFLLLRGSRCSDRLFSLYEAYVAALCFLVVFGRAAPLRFLAWLPYSLSLGLLANTLSNLLQNATISCTIAPIMTTETNNKDFAVIATGGKQYIVSAGDTIKVELLGDHKEGDTIEFDQVLMKNDTVGTPVVAGAKVKATFLGEKKAQKISILRYKAKSNRNRKQGHRQKHAEVKIESI